MIRAHVDKLLWSGTKTGPEHSQTRVVTTRHSSVRVRDSGGQGRVLVFLCDPPIMVEAYDQVINAFDEYRVIVLELPGFGFSKLKRAEGLTFEGAVEAAEEALLTFDLPDFVLFGPCICGFVAVELCQRKRLSIKGLVLMQVPDEIGMRQWVGRMDPKYLLRTPLLGQLMVRLGSRRLSRFWLRYATSKSFNAAGLVQVTDDALKAGAGYPLASLLQLWSSGVRNAQLRVPALIVWGKQDRSHRGTDPQCTKQHVAHADVAVFEDCGHFSELEQPTEFAQKVGPYLAQWLTGQPSAR